MNPVAEKFNRLARVWVFCQWSHALGERGYPEIDAVLLCVRRLHAIVAGRVRD